MPFSEYPEIQWKQRTFCVHDVSLIVIFSPLHSDAASVAPSHPPQYTIGVTRPFSSFLYQSRMPKTFTKYFNSVISLAYLTVAFSSALLSMFPFPCLDLHGPYDVACRFHQCSGRHNIITRLIKIPEWWYSMFHKSGNLTSESLEWVDNNPIIKW